jgi:hypothetical protein
MDDFFGFGMGFEMDFFLDDPDVLNRQAHSGDGSDDKPPEGIPITADTLLVGHVPSGSTPTLASASPLGRASNNSSVLSQPTAKPAGTHPSAATRPIASGSPLPPHLRSATDSALVFITVLLTTLYLTSL